MTVILGSLIKLRLYTLVCIVSVLFLVSISEAASTELLKLNLESKYQLEIPKSWKLHEEDTTKTWTRLTDSKISAANIRQNSGQSRIIVAANKFSGNSTSATVRLSVRQAKTMSQNDVKQMTQNDINELSNGTEADLQKNEIAVGDDVRTKLISVNRKVINGKFCISSEMDKNYSGIKTMRNITDLYFLGDRYVELTVSYNQAEAKTYKSMVNKIRNSLTIK